jgi:hypothetical protein
MMKIGGGGTGKDDVLSIIFICFVIESVVIRSVFLQRSGFYFCSPRKGKGIGIGIGIGIGAFL